MMLRSGPGVTHSLCCRGFHRALTRRGSLFPGIISHVLSLMPSNPPLGELVSRSERERNNDGSKELAK